jgi:hypothetical protein
LLVVDIVLVPGLDAVYANDVDLELFVTEPVAGEKVPPPLPLEGVITAVPAKVPAPSVAKKPAHGTPTVQEVGPVKL